MSGSFQTVKAEICKPKRVGRTLFESETDFEGSKALRVGPFVFIPGWSRGNRVNKFVWMVLDVEKNEWRRVRCSGRNRMRGIMFVYNDCILRFGPEKWFSRFERYESYDLVLGEWSSWKPQGMAPPNRFKFAGGFMERIRSYVIFGGRTGSTLYNSVHMLDVHERRWIYPVIKGSPPSARYSHTACVHSGALYCYGGMSSSGRYLHDGIFILHVTAGNVATWSHPKTTALGRPPPSNVIMIPFHGAFLFYHRLELFKYDPKSQRFSTVFAQAGTDFTGFPWDPVAIHIRKGNELALFYGYDAVRYVRLSVVD